jgi:hypothetical protein
MWEVGSVSVLIRTLERSELYPGAFDGGGWIVAPERRQKDNGRRRQTKATTSITVTPGKRQSLLSRTRAK